MEEQIIISITPFTLAQKISVVQEDRISNFEFTLDEIPKKVCLLSKQYDIQNIKIKGDESYCLKFKNDIINNKYEKQKINVEILKGDKRICF